MALSAQLVHASFTRSVPLSGAAIAPQCRPVRANDFSVWRSLWRGYNATAGRKGKAALSDDLIDTLWQRLLAPHVPIDALVAESNGKIVGFCHYTFHYSTSSIAQICYLNDLYVDPKARRCGAATALILACYAAAEKNGASAVYWLTPADSKGALTFYKGLAEQVDMCVFRKMF